MLDRVLTIIEELAKLLLKIEESPDEKGLALDLLKLVKSYR